jgi:hypothetical protein
MATWEQATDAYGIVNPQGNRGAAQIFQDDAVDKNLARIDRGLATKLAAEKKKKADEDAMKAALKIDADGWIAADGAMLSQMTSDWIKKGSELIKNKKDPRYDSDMQIERERIKQLAQVGKEEQKFFDTAMTEFMKNANQYDPEEAQAFLLQAEKYKTARPSERNPALLTQPAKIKEDKGFDLLKPVKDTQVGLFTNVDKTAEGGRKTVGIRKADIETQATGIVSSNPDMVKWGISKGVWENEKDAKDFYVSQLIAKANTTSEDILPRAGDKDKTTGHTKEEIKNNFQQWKTDLFDGDEDAAAYLLDTKQGAASYNATDFAMSKYIPEGNEQGAAMQPKRSNYQFTYTLTGKPIRETKDGVVDLFSPTDKMVVNPNTMTDEELFKVYLNSLYQRKKMFREGEIKQTTIGEKSKSETTKKVPASKIKSLVGTKGYEGYTEKELIEYYKSQGYIIE